MFNNGPNWNSRPALELPSQLRRFIPAIVVVHVQQVAIIAAGLKMHRAFALVAGRLGKDHFLDEAPEEVQVIHRRIRFANSAWAWFLSS